VTLASSESATALVAVDTGDTWVLTVPVSKVNVSFPRGNLARYEQSAGGATESPRYFQLRDAARGLVISGWLESEASWEGWKKFFAGEFAGLLKSQYPPSKAPDQLEVGPWQGFSYEVDLTSERSAHLRVERRESGTWLDLHISVTGDGPVEELHARAIAFLKTIEMKRK